MNDALPPSGPQLTVPSAGASVPPEAITDPATLGGEAVARLLADPTTAASWLAQQLAMLNRAPLAASARQALAVAVEPPIATLRDVAQTYSSNLGPAAQLERREFFDAMARLATEHAYAWKLSLTDATGAVSPAARDEPASLANALRALELEALLAYSLYSSLTHRTWRETIEITRLAAALGCMDRPATISDSDGVPTEQTIGRLFQRLLLTHLLLPQRLPRGGVWLAHRYLERHGALCEFVPARREAAGEFHLSVDLDGPMPRVISAEMPQELGSPRARHLRLTGLFARVREEYAELEKGRQPPGLDDAPLELARQVLKGMLVAWYLRPPRQAKRESAAGWLNAVVGLEQIVSRQDADGTGGTPDPAATQARCFQLDQSSNGVALEFRNHWSTAVQIGQLLLLQRKDSDLLAMPERFVAVIRRFVLRPGDVLMAGLQRLPGRPLPVDVHDPNDRLPARRGLLLRRSGASRLVLLAPPGVYCQHAEYALSSAEGDLVALADKLLERTEFFDRIEMSAAERLPASLPSAVIAAG